jgi:hypothetical protein
MNAGVAEQIKWWNAVDVLDELPDLDDSSDEQDIDWPDVDVADTMLRLARACQHPDAQWLASLFPAGEELGRRRVQWVLRQQGEDPRALFLVWRLEIFRTRATQALLERSAALGYAPAQVKLASMRNGQEQFQLASDSAAQGDRRGLCQLAFCLLYGEGCEMDKARAIQTYREAAELESPHGEYYYGREAFGEHDAERYVWWGRSSLQGGSAMIDFVRGVLGLLPSFEEGELGEILHVTAPLLAQNIHVQERRVFQSTGWDEDTFVGLKRVIALHRAMLGRARRAIACWSIVAHRRGLVQDVRMIISKMAWSEAWRWAAKRSRGQRKSAKKN